MAFAGIFPGQGSQSSGMLTNLAESFPVVTQTFEEASGTLSQDLWRMVLAEDASELNQTVNTQPAMLAASVAVWRVWQEQGGALPSAVAGHSLGEYSALVVAGNLDYSDAIGLVRARATYMQDAVPEGQGAMAAILGLDDAIIIDVCKQASAEGVAQAVNFNSPGQVVIAGDAGAVAKALELASEQGAKRAVNLPVSVPSHCELMRPAAEKLAEGLADVAIANGNMPVIHNVTAAESAEISAIPGLLTEQLYKPVRWVESVQYLAKQFSADRMIEFGPGKVLMGLNRRIDRSIKTVCVHDVASLEKGLALCEEDK